MSKWYSIPRSIAISDYEYRANINGINIVFGAVLGFVLARAEGLPPIDFIIVLIASSAAVIAILYLGSSEYRLFYGALAAALVACLPWLLDEADIPQIPKLQPTLIAWTIMVLVVELTPRRIDTPSLPEDTKS